MTFDFDHHEFNIRLIEAVERAHKKPSFDGSKRDSVRRYQMWMSQLVRDVEDLKKMSSQIALDNECTTLMEELQKIVESAGQGDLDETGRSQDAPSENIKAMYLLSEKIVAREEEIFELARVEYRRAALKCSIALKGI